MKKKLLSIITISIFIFSTYAFATEKGNVFFQTAIGYGTGWGVSYSSVLIPPIVVQMDYTLRDDIGPGSIVVGGQLSYESYKNDFASGSPIAYGWKQSRLLIGATASYHYSPLNKLDTYSRFILSYRIINANSNGDWPTNIIFLPEKNGVTAGITVGAKYMLTENIGAFTEIGYNAGIFIFGLSFKL